MNNFNELLTGINPSNNLLSKGLILYSIDKPLNNLEIDIRLQKGRTDICKCFLNIIFSYLVLSTNGLESIMKFITNKSLVCDVAIKRAAPQFKR